MVKEPMTHKAAVNELEKLARQMTGYLAGMKADDPVAAILVRRLDALDYAMAVLKKDDTEF